jgi:hypothetical protein
MRTTILKLKEDLYIDETSLILGNLKWARKGDIVFSNNLVYFTGEYISLFDKAGDTFTVKYHSDKFEIVSSTELASVLYNK